MAQNISYKSDMVKILVVEDDKETNNAICEYLHELNYVTIAAFDGEEALDFFFKENVNIVLLDIMLPKISGSSVLQKIRKHSETPVIMITAVSNEFTQIECFDKKADDYITKPFSLVILGKRIEALLRKNSQSIELDLLRFGDIVVDFSGYSAFSSKGKINVTPKEFQLLKYLVTHPGYVLTRDQLLTALWDDHSCIIDRTIDEYIKNLRKKLLIDNIITVKGIGYKYEVKK